MRPVALLAAATLAAAPAHARAHHDHRGLLAQAATPAYARAIAAQTCRYMREGMEVNDAGRRALRDLFPVFGADMKRDTFDTAAALIVGERLILCPELK